MAPAEESGYALGMADNNVESELKIPVIDLNPVRTALREIGAVLERPMERESNLVLDSADRRLAASESLLRLRRHGSVHLLTFKGPARFTGAVKQREELEIEISSLTMMEAILARLGFGVCLRYEKKREVWRHDEVSIALDHTPIGDFLEIEGDGRKLGHLAARLGLEVGDAVRASYVSLWQEHRAHHPELDLPSDMVFPE